MGQDATATGMTSPYYGAYKERHFVISQTIYTHSELRENLASLQVSFQYCLNRHLFVETVCFLSAHKFKPCNGEPWLRSFRAPSLSILNCALKSPILLSNGTNSLNVSPVSRLAFDNCYSLPKSSLWDMASCPFSWQQTHNGTRLSERLVPRVWKAGLYPGLCGAEWVIHF